MPFTGGRSPLFTGEWTYARTERAEEDIEQELDLIMALVCERRGMPGMADERHPEECCTAMTDLAVVGEMLWARRGTEKASFFDVRDLEGNPLCTCSAPVLPYCSMAAFSPGVPASPACGADPMDRPVVYIPEMTGGETRSVIRSAPGRVVRSPAVMEVVEKCSSC